MAMSLLSFKWKKKEGKTGLLYLQDSVLSSLLSDGPFVSFL